MLSINYFSFLLSTTDNKTKDLLYYTRVSCINLVLSIEIKLLYLWRGVSEIIGWCWSILCESLQLSIHS